MQLSKNFKLSEFSKVPVSGYVSTNLIVLANQLQKIRDHFGKPVTIHVGVNDSTPEHKEGKAAVFSIAGLSADQIKAGMEGRVYNGTIGLLNGNKVYYSLAPNGQRFDQRTQGGGGTTPTTTTPTPDANTPTVATNKNQKTVLLVGTLLALVVLGAYVFKDKK